MKFVFTILIIWYPVLASPQNRTIDSLKLVLRTQKEDTNKINTLNELAYQLAYFDADTALSIFKTALTLATRLNYQPAIADIKTGMGKLYFTQGLYIEGLRFANDALIIYTDLLPVSSGADNEKLLTKLADCYNVLELNIFPQGNYPEALRIALLELKTREKIRDKKGIAYSQFNIGNIYYCQHNYSEALKHHSICLKLCEQLGNKADISSTANAIGLVYFDQGNYEAAEKSYSYALKMGEEAKDSSVLAEVFIDIGLLKEKQNNHNEALKYDLAALRIYEKNGISFNMPFVLNNIAMIYLQQKKYKDVEEYLARALSVAQKTNHLEYIKLSYENMVKFDSVRGDYKMALQHYQLAILYRDSMLNTENTKKITQQQMQYEFDKRQDSIRAVQDKKDALAVAQIKNQKLIRNFSLTGAVAIIGFGSFSFYRYRRRRKLQSQQEMLNERLRISRELHDDIGSTLGSISIYSEVAKNRSEKNKNADEAISKIGTASRELIEKMSDIVWSINPNNESFEQLQNRMQAFAAMMLTPRNIHYDFNADEEVKKLNLTAEQRKNIFLIYKEAVHNIVKYAECEKVEISLSGQNNVLAMNIRDDGKGFNVDQLNAETNNGTLGGNGLKNMQARANDIKAVLNIHAAINDGTTVQVRLEL